MSLFWFAGDYFFFYSIILISSSSFLIIMYLLMFNFVRENIDFIPFWLKCEHAIYAKRLKHCRYLQNLRSVLHHTYYTLCFC